MMFIVQISDDVGVFQFLGVLAIKLSRGKPVALMSILCSLAMFFSALINNILAVMILIPLTITISRILSIDPTPYILTEAVIVNMGATFFSISSIPNILIVTEQNISFNAFFLHVGIFSFFIGILRIGFFIFLYKKELSQPRSRFVMSLEDFNVWNFVQSRRLLFTSIGAIVLVMIGFIAIPASIIPPCIIAMSTAMILAIFSSFNGLKPKEIMKKFDIELLLYLLGIFIIAGALEEVGILALIASLFERVGSNNYILQIVFIVWASGFLSSLIDNIPITKVLIPIVKRMQEALSLNIGANNNLFYAMAYGANWGDNFTPLGDNIIVVNIAEQNKRPIKIKTFFKIGATTTFLQLIFVSIYFILQSNIYYIGIILVFIIFLVVGIVFIFSKYGNEQIKSVTNKVINKFRTIIIS